ncbi:MAG TPA: FGGY family carbohydrate kinase [Aestuariivirga sp.]|jgi:xylulokinase|nr:xylulose kinase [Hyphomicrobiales bacterium]MBP9173770.1 xylulose kinase [Hyphomicrobiales bacterium]MCC7480095.1 xylulose kinase [Hyphomicrobiales bacterium]HQY72868.1 FGGY family carbohydrate kinase [Aestuariivirga sp.]HRA92372.1 FGGY family carbohydrate kinase [Aestuariivirga sp.]
MKTDLVIGLDSSTTTTKAIAWDRRGRAVAEGRAGVPMSNPKPGWFEQDVGDWTNGAAKALKQLSKKIDMARVGAIAISNQRESFAQFDSANRPLRPGTLWLDERAHAEAKELAQLIGAEELHRISGKPSDVTPCISRCLWLAKSMPGLWKKTAMTAEVHGILVHFLTGQWHTSTASADPMGLIDMEQYDWSDELLAAARLSRSQLPKLFRPGEVMGEVTPAAARLTGLKAGTLVVAGGGDGQCAGTGANTFVAGRAYLNLGTAVVSGSFGKAYAHNPVFRTMSAVAEEGYSYETAIRTGTFLVNWMVERLFNVKASKNPGIFAALEREAKASPPGSRGVMLVPYWLGCMTPYWSPKARGVIAGLSGNHSRGDIYRAVLEGIALEQVMMTDGVAAATQAIDHIVVMGGGAQSDLWCQIVADAGSRDVRRLETVEASSLGAAMAAAKGAGWFKNIPAASESMSGKPSRTFRPRARENKAYRELMAVYRDLWPTLSQWNARLQAISGDT